jgi:glycosyltransferase involved in cell wall biosynthesis
MTGYADETTLHALYASARALLFPTLYEGFGIPVAEAMAAGLPAIVSDIPVMREVTGGMAGFVAPLDADGWAAAILRAIEAGDGLTERRAEARLASAAFTWEETARATAAIYRELA